MTEKEAMASAPQDGYHCMTAAQFDKHLVPLMGRHSGSKRLKALRLVLVDGLTAYAAAKRVQVGVSSVTKAVTEAREAMSHVVALHYPVVRMPPTREEKAGAAKA